MTRSLTQMREDVVREIVSEVEAKIAARGEAGVRWRDHFDLAAYRYELEIDRASVLCAFAATIRAGVAAYAHAPKLDSIRTPFYFGQLTGIVAAFGGPADRARIAAIPRNHFLMPEMPEYTAMADAYSALQSYLDGTPDHGIARRAVEAQQRRDRDSFHYSRPLARAVLGLADGDAAVVTAAVAAMADLHLHLAREGDLQTGAAGCIAVLPLGVMRLARERGLECTLDSPYVPLELLRAESDAS
jgi:hypothetical protein